jgi:uncharacterized membrane protein YeiH
VDSPESLIPWLRVAVESAATVAFALSGLLAGARQRLDAVGLCFVTGLAAFGGGTLRDVLLVCQITQDLRVLDALEKIGRAHV